jgi:molecular chaperone Hsp33
MNQREFSTPAIAGDGIDTYLLADGTYRLSFVHGTELVNRMRANHLLGPGGTLILGEAYLLTLLAAGTLKNEERTGMLVTCDGRVEGISVDANALGHVRGYLKNGEVSLAEANDPATLFGSGTLSVLRWGEKMRHPQQGQVALQGGSLARNVAHYYAGSEQTATFLDINIHFNDTGAVAGAGGVMIQALPGADLDQIDAFARRLEGIRPIGGAFAGGATAVHLVREHLSDWHPNLVATKPAEFYCSCSKDRFSRFLAALPEDEKADILDTGPIPLHTTCHNCNTTYTFDRDELESLFQESPRDPS